MTAIIPGKPYLFIEPYMPTNIAYDGLGRRTQRTLSGTQSETFGYDPVGNLRFHTNFNGADLNRTS